MYKKLRKNPKIDETLKIISSTNHETNLKYFKIQQLII